MIKYFLLFIILSISVYSNEIAKKQITVENLGNSAIKIDGKLNEEFWQKANYHDDFIVKEPNEGDKPSEITKFTIAYDKDALYFAARMYRKDIDKIRTTSFKRDNTFNAEKIILVLDTYFDKRTAYSFLVTASGSISDYVSNDDSEYDRDFTYNPIWEAAANIDSLGWTAEMRIPFTQLRFSHKDSIIFGLNINQYTPSNREDIYYAYIPRESFGWSSKFAVLSGFEDIKPTTRLELQPFANGRITQNPFYNRDSPYEKAVTTNLNYGLDAKFGITQDITLDATILPDFGQVELDPSVVNLSAYEVYYSERRPFFTEGKQIFDRLGDLFYSRRIGGTPHGDLSQGVYNKIPQTTEILGAAKFSGRLANKITIAGLSALTNKMYGNFTLNGQNYQEEIEPLTSYNLLRIEKEFDKENSFLALSATGVERSLCDCNNLINLLPKRAYTGGLEFQYRLFDGNYTINTKLLFSHIYGRKEAILLRQTASARFLQRPSSYIALDPNLNEMDGYGYFITFSKYAGENWIWGVIYSELSPYFDLNDMGKVQTVDNRNFSYYLLYRDLKATDYYYSYSLEAYNNLQFDFAGLRLKNDIGFSAIYNLLNRDAINLSLITSPSVFSNSETRGGWAMLLPSKNALNFSYNSDFSKRITYVINANFYKNDVGSKYNNYYLQLKSQVLDQLELTFGFGYTYNVNKAQYITTILNSKNRYIFSEIEQNTLFFDVRANYVFTPTLTLELYMQPFISNGIYSNFGELSAPLTNKLITYGKDNETKIDNIDNKFYVTDKTETFSISNPNFNIIAFRSNLVLRWEWIRGSYLYFVWQATNENFDNVIKFHSNNIFDSFSNGKMNVLALKISYWLPTKF